MLCEVFLQWWAISHAHSCHARGGCCSLLQVSCQLIACLPVMDTQMYSGFQWEQQSGVNNVQSCHLTLLWLLRLASEPSAND